MKNILFLLITSSFLWSGIGNIGVIKGNANMVRDTHTINIKNGMNIEVTDKIITKTKSRVQALLNDDTIVTIGPNSIFVFDAYKFGNKSNSKVNMHIERGFFRSVTGQIGKLAPERFNIKTVSTTIGIRGTDFSAYVSDEKEIIICHRGKIAVTVGKKIYNVDEGEQLILVKKSSKKSSDSDNDSFSVIIGDNMSSADKLIAQAASGTLNNENVLNTVQKSNSNANTFSEIESEMVVDATQRDAIPPLEEPIIEFPDR